jgi:CubicO group peptidase (beta-lactamase class C family)
MKELLRRLTALVMVSLLAGCAGHSATPSPDGWRTSNPKALGMDDSLLAKAARTIEQEGLAVHSMLVIRNGAIVTERYYSPYEQGTKHDLHSVTKSVISALVGIAIDKGFIGSVEDPVLSYFPDHIPHGDPRRDALTLEHLLTMSSGLGQTEILEMLQSEDAVQHVLNLEMTSQPGAIWDYNDGNYHILSAILQQATGMSALEFAQAHLCAPLDISDVTWGSDQNGITMGGWGLWMTPRDMAKIGLLYLNEGVWEGEQIVPAEWVHGSVERQFQIEEPGEPWALHYGYGWWVHDIGAFAAHGSGGQFIYVIPDLDVVVVFTGGLNALDFVEPELLIRDYVMPAVVSSASPGGTRGTEFRIPATAPVGDQGWRSMELTDIRRERSGGRRKGPGRPGRLIEFS